jgi:hypothetical protein
MAQLTEPPDAISAVAALCALDDIAQEAKMLATDAERVVLETGEKRLETPYGLVERMPGVVRKAWQHDRVAYKVADKADDPVKAILDAAGISYWRTTVLRQFGLDPDEFCDVERGPAKLKIVRTNATGASEEAPGRKGDTME